MQYPAVALGSLLGSLEIISAIGSAWRAAVTEQATHSISPLSYPVRYR